ncbi:ammonium transporter [Sphingomonas deserti]|uniref:Ammonium transporter n=1 Tax=Allosphingosinicella deserti TaxID=2116704 RepID=A0A2P7R048_9SPHN|nr:ammonium transporter [Sphingomonas deserti]
MFVGLAWAGGLILLALAASLAHRQDIISHDTTLRLVIGANGLMIAFYGNRAPKALAPTACARQLARFAGWSMVLSGLFYAGLWAFAPIPTAVTLGTIAVAAGALATLSYGLGLRARGHAENSGAR